MKLLTPTIIKNNGLKHFLANRAEIYVPRCDDAHQYNHVNYVLRREYELSKNEDVNPEMLFVQGVYHDFGYAITKDGHEQLSADILQGDKALRKFFGTYDILTMAEAVASHAGNYHAKNGEPPRTVYGKLLNQADKIADIHEIMRRAYAFAGYYAKKKGIILSTEEKIMFPYNRSMANFGKNGLAVNCHGDVDEMSYRYFPDPELERGIAESNKYLTSIEVFARECLKTNGIDPNTLDLDNLHKQEQIEHQKNLDFIKTL